jgi:hypothetical protein
MGGVNAAKLKRDGKRQQSRALAAAAAARGRGVPGCSSAFCPGKHVWLAIAVCVAAICVWQMVRQDATRHMPHADTHSFSSQQNNHPSTLLVASTNSCSSFCSYALNGSWVLKVEKVRYLLIN